MAFRDGNYWMLTVGDPGYDEGIMMVSANDEQPSIKEQFEKKMLSDEEMQSILGDMRVEPPGADAPSSPLLPKLPVSIGNPYPALAQELFGMFLASLGLDTEDEHLKDTPRRVVDLYMDRLIPNHKEFAFTTFEPGQSSDQMVSVNRIPFTSFCAHHLLPFTGLAHISYIPNGKMGGLSKFARTVHYFANQPQVQERLTFEVAGALEALLEPRGVAVTIDARHSCMELRGPQAVGSVTRTTVLRGAFKENPETRAEYFAQVPQEMQT